MTSAWSPEENRRIDELLRSMPDNWNLPKLASKHIGDFPGRSMFSLRAKFYKVKGMKQSKRKKTKERSSTDPPRRRPSRTTGCHANGTAGKPGLVSGRRTNNSNATFLMALPDTGIRGLLSTPARNDDKTPTTTSDAPSDGGPSILALSRMKSPDKGTQAPQAKPKPKPKPTLTLSRMCKIPEYTGLRLRPHPLALLSKQNTHTGAVQRTPGAAKVLEWLGKTRNKRKRKRSHSPRGPTTLAECFTMQSYAK